MRPLRVTFAMLISLTIFRSTIPTVPHRVTSLRLSQMAARRKQSCGPRSACKPNDLHRSLNRKAPPMELQPLDLVQCPRRHITLAAVRTGHNRNVFDNEQVFSLPVASCNPPLASAFLSANVTYYCSNSSSEILYTGSPYASRPLTERSLSVPLSMMLPCAGIIYCLLLC